MSYIISVSMIVDRNKMLMAVCYGARAIVEILVVLQDTRVDHDGIKDIILHVNFEGFV